MNTRTFLSSGRAALVALTAAFALGACGDDGGDGPADTGVDTSPDVTADAGMDTTEADTMADTSDDTEVTEPGTIPEVAIAAGSFTVLVDALVTADLVDTLSGDGPFTVFAPTDDAFDALPEGTLESLTTEQLTDILLYHVVAGALPASAVLAETELEMVNGDMAAVAVTEDGATIDGAGIAVTDVVARNGIIHVIDAVMLPPTE